MNPVTQAIIAIVLVVPCVLFGQNQIDSKQLFGELFEKAMAGDAPAQFQLGIKYANGNGVTRDEAEAARWFRKAADQGNAKAQFNLGAMYTNGTGVPKDEAEAVRWYRKAADLGDPAAQFNLGASFDRGIGVPKDKAKAIKWFRKAADQENAPAQARLGFAYANGTGVPKDEAEAVRWYRKAADQGNAKAQFNLGVMYANGTGVPKDEAEAVRLYMKAADQGNATAQFLLGIMYANGQGVPKDETEAYFWFLLSGAQGKGKSREYIALLESAMTPDQRFKGQKRARDFSPNKPNPATGEGIAEADRTKELDATGSGFFITDDGWLVTNAHVVVGSYSVQVLTSYGLLAASVVHCDTANDIALLKVTGTFDALPIVPSRTVKLGHTVATVGFPNVDLQGFSPKLSKGEIASLAGAQDDPRYFQISVAVQPGNSGGPLVDSKGNVVGIVSAKLDTKAALTTSGQLPENVNYAIKSGFLLTFLEAVPEISAKLKDINVREIAFEEVVATVQQAAALVLVYR